MLTKINRMTERSQHFLEIIHTKTNKQTTNKFFNSEGLSLLFHQYCLFTPFNGRFCGGCGGTSDYRWLRCWLSGGFGGGFSGWLGNSRSSVQWDGTVLRGHVISGRGVEERLVGVKTRVGKVFQFFRSKIKT